MRIRKGSVFWFIILEVSFASWHMVEQVLMLLRLHGEWTQTEVVQ